MTVAWVVSFLLGAGLLAVAILLVYAALVVGRWLGRAEMLASMLQWPSISRCWPRWRRRGMSGNQTTRKSREPSGVRRSV